MSKLLNYLVQPFSLHDGFGIRSTLFLKGCTLSCKWCHNPESISKVPEMSFNSSNCIGCDDCFVICDKNAIIENKKVVGLKIDPELCTLCGDCATVCKMTAIQKIGDFDTVENIYEKLVRDKPFFDSTGGGVTISGGEPLYQSENLLELLKLLNDDGAHVLVETCANVPWKNIENCLDYIDHFYVDIKAIDEDKHEELTGQKNEIILSNIRKLLSIDRNKVTLRMPVIPGQNDSEENLILLANLLKDFDHREITLLRYHKMYEPKKKHLNFCRHEKSEELGINWEEESILSAERILKEQGIKVNLPLPQYQQEDLSSTSSFFSDRIYRLKESVESFPREICTDRSNLSSKFYSFRNKKKRGKNMPKQLEKSELISFILRNKKKIIYPDELIVGNYTGKRVSGPNHPELHGIASLEDILKFTGRKTVPLKTTFKEKLDLLKLYIKFAKNNAISKTFGIFSTIPRAEEMLAGNEFFINEFGGIAHFVPQWEKILRLGIPGLKKEVQEKKKKMEVVDKNEDRKYIFYESLEIVCDGLSDLCKLYSEEAERMILSENDDDEKRIEDLKKIKEVCENISENAPKTFHEAIQLMMFFQIAINLEAVDQGICPGRLDVLLLPFFNQDIKNGDLDISTAKELIACFFIKLNELIPLFSSRTIQRFHGGNPSGQVVNVGGTDPAPNELTFLIMDVHKHLHMRQPNFYCRIPSPDDRLREGQDIYISKVASLLRDGRALPAIANDSVVIPMLHEERKFDLEDAEDYIMIGCVEPGTSSLYGSTDCGLVNLGTAFQRSLQSFENSEPPKSTQEVFEAYQKESRELFAKFYSWQNKLEKVLKKDFPVPLSSLCLNGCVESGYDANEGGAKINASGVQGVGIVDIANSLVAIEHLVFNNDGSNDFNKLTWKEFMDILEDDFLGNENLQRYLLERVPKFGNGDSEVDEYAQLVMNDFADTVGEYENERGGRFCSGFYSMTTHKGFGAVLNALPSGRGKGGPLTSGVTPQGGTDREGPTGMCRSVASLNPRRNTWNGYNFNLSIDTSFMESEIGELAVEGLVIGFCDSGGMQIQTNIMDPMDLVRAKEKPEDYPNLVVRVSGYSAYFKDLDEEMKDEIISRFNL